MSNSQDNTGINFRTLSEVETHIAAKLATAQQLNRWHDFNYIHGYIISLTEVLEYLSYIPADWWLKCSEKVVVEMEVDDTFEALGRKLINLACSGEFQNRNL